MSRTIILSLLYIAHVIASLQGEDIVICGYPNEYYCAIKSPTNRTSIVFRNSVFNTTKFYWPDMGMVNMMHDNVVRFDDIHEIDFADNCHWEFSWRMAMEWSATSLRVIKFNPECAHWSRVYEYCVNVPNQWRRRLHLVNAELCAVDDKRHQNWVQNSEEDMSDELPDDLQVVERKIRHADARVARELPRNRIEHEDRADADNARVLPISGESQDDASTTSSVHHLRAVIAHQVKEIEQLKITYEHRILALQTDVAACRSTLGHWMETAQKCATPSLETRHVSFKAHKQLQHVQAELARLSSTVAGLLDENLP